MSQPDHPGSRSSCATNQPQQRPSPYSQVVGDLSPCELPMQAKTNQGLIGRFRELVYKTFFKPLVFSRNPPSFDARAVSVGLVVGFLMPLGSHLVSLALLRILFRFNYVVAAGFTLVSNPFNIIPLYYGYYCLGSVLIGKPTALNFQSFEKLVNPITDQTYLWEALPAFMELGSEILVRWLAAAVFLAMLFGVVGYVVTYKIQQNRCRKAAREMGLRYEEFLDRLSKDFPSDHV
jgi:uncharacterized protein